MARFSATTRRLAIFKGNNAAATRRGRVWSPDSTRKRPRLKRYLSEMKGAVMGCIWTDIPPINSQAQERLGYPTQKPEALLDRIINASSSEGDTVLNPFCGCGTAIAVAQRLSRKWIGIDITHLAIALMKYRMQNAFGESIKDSYEVIGEPVDLEGAKALSKESPYQFQWWALGLVNARPTEQKKGADKGIDGRIFFHDEPPGGKTKQIILSVKAGKLHAPYVRDLRGVVEREKAAIGVLISMEEPTKPMRKEAASAGFYESNWNPGKTTEHSKIQIITVKNCWTERRSTPRRCRTFARSKKPPRQSARWNIPSPDVLGRQGIAPADHGVEKLRNVIRLLDTLAAIPAGRRHRVG